MTAVNHKITTKLGPWVDRPLVNLSPEIVPFWEGLQLHEFRLCRCRRCGACYFPYTLCVRHGDIPDFDEMEWQPTSGRGRVFSRLIVRRVIDPDYRDDAPYVLALVELDEGPLFSTRIINCVPNDVHIGDAVQVAFYDAPTAGHTLPLFAPV